jgi:hypothetical protein
MPGLSGGLDGSIFDCSISDGSISAGSISAGSISVGSIEDYKALKGDSHTYGHASDTSIF